MSIDSQFRRLEQLQLEYCEMQVRLLIVDALRYKRRKI